VFTVPDPVEDLPDPFVFGASDPGYKDFIWKDPVPDPNPGIGLTA
jgi:hypothetical protein